MLRGYAPVGWKGINQRGACLPPAAPHNSRILAKPLRQADPALVSSSGRPLGDNLTRNSRHMTHPHRVLVPPPAAVADADQEVTTVRYAKCVQTC